MSETHKSKCWKLFRSVSCSLNRFIHASADLQLLTELNEKKKCWGIANKITRIFFLLGHSKIQGSMCIQYVFYHIDVKVIDPPRVKWYNLTFKTLGAVAIPSDCCGGYCCDGLHFSTLSMLRTMAAGTAMVLNMLSVGKWQFWNSLKNTSKSKNLKMLEIAGPTNEKWDVFNILHVGLSSHLWVLSNQ